MPTVPAETSAQRRARARHAALRKNALQPDDMSRARDGRRRLFETTVDPDGSLDPAERAKRTDRLFAAWMTALSIERSKKRRGQPYRKLVLAEWLAGAAATKKAAPAAHAETALEERDAGAPTPKEERRVGDALA